MSRYQHLCSSPRRAGELMRRGYGGRRRRRQLYRRAGDQMWRALWADSGRRGYGGRVTSATVLPTCRRPDVEGDLGRGRSGRRDTVAGRQGDDGAVDGEKRWSGREERLPDLIVCYFFSAGSLGL